MQCTRKQNIICPYSLFVSTHKCTLKLFGSTFCHQNFFSGRQKDRQTSKNWKVLPLFSFSSFVSLQWYAMATVCCMQRLHFLSFLSWKICIKTDGFNAISTKQNQTNINLILNIKRAQNIFFLFFEPNRSNYILNLLSLINTITIGNG